MVIHNSQATLRIACLLLTVSATAFANAADVHPQDTAQSKGAGKIVGRVLVEGHYDRPAPFKVYKNRDFCGLQVPNESLLVGFRGGVQNVVVTIPKARGEKMASPAKGLVLDNRNCAFVPHVQIAPVGSEILLVNSDPILHDVHARLGSETLFNEGLPTWRQVTKRLTRAGIIAIHCEVLHTWMSAYILVTSSPYFAVTDEKGEFVIDDVPAGTREIKVWHEKLGTQSKKITVTVGTTHRVDVVYPSKK